MTDNQLMIAGLIGLIGLILVLITQRWFWVLLFFLATAASFFAMIASVIHFQILGAVGYLVAMVMCMLFMGAIAATESY